MVIVQQDSEEKLKTTSQEQLLAKIIQSEALTKAERDNIVKNVRGKLITSFDMSVLISYILAKMRFHRHFVVKRKHSVAECHVCKNRVGLVKIDNPLADEKFWLCPLCKLQWDSPDPVSSVTKEENDGNE